MPKKKTTAPQPTEKEIVNAMHEICSKQYDSFQATVALQYARVMWRIRPDLVDGSTPWPSWLVSIAKRGLDGWGNFDPEAEEVGGGWRDTGLFKPGVMEGFRKEAVKLATKRLKEERRAHAA